MAGNIKVFLIVLLAVCTLADEFNPNYNYNDFMRQYNRTYEGEEKITHEKKFNQSYAELLKLRAQGHDVVVNKYMDWTQEQKDSFFNFDPTKTDYPVTSRALRVSALFAAPSSFDWRTYDRVSAVKDQGDCGSCWAFAVTAQYQSLMAISRKGNYYNFAQQYPLECDKGSFRCNGGSPLSSLNLFKNGGGIPVQMYFPYNYLKNYTNICTNTSIRTKPKENVTGIYYYDSITTEQLQQDLMSIGPITVGVYSGEAVFHGAGPTGLISCGANIPGINHAVLLVGFNTTHWFIKNSWGTGWGHNGYGYINKSADCNIKTYVNQMQFNFTSSQMPNPNPSPTPAPTEYLNLTIYMTDSYADGWDGNILALKQNNVIVGTFGQTFTSGGSIPPVFISVQGNAETQIVVSQFGRYSEEVEFAVAAPNGTYIYRKTRGTKFNSTTIFSTFCPINSCPSSPNVTYYVTMTDTGGDGWNGNVLAFQQGGIVISNFSLADGGQSAFPLAYDFKKLSTVTLTVYILGGNTDQIGFVIRNSAGAVVFQRTPGTAFFANTILGTFCPECINLSPVIILTGTVGTSNAKQETETKVISQNQDKSYRIATYVLASVLLLTLIALGFTVFKYIKVTKYLPEESKEKISNENPSILSTVEVVKNI